MAKSVGNKVADSTVIRSINILRYSESLRERVIVHLKELEAELVAAIQAADIEGVKRASTKIRRQEALLKQTKTTISTAYLDINRTMAAEMNKFAAAESVGVLKSINTAIQIDLLTTALTAEHLKEIVSRSLIQGGPQQNWWAKQSQDTAHRFANQVRLGVSAGEGTNDIVKRIRGASTGRRRVITIDGERKIIAEFTGGIMNVSTREATALVRTSVQTIANNTHMAVYKEHEDMLKGIKALVTLDNRTSKICMARSGGMWDMDGNPLPDSPVKDMYPGNPPWHFNCRSVITPIIKSWAELGLGNKFKDVPESTRASMDGQVPADLTYEKWLKTKSETFQKDVLGPGRYKLWKDGKLKMPQLIDQSGRAKTLDQLKKAV